MFYVLSLVSEEIDKVHFQLSAFIKYVAYEFNKRKNYHIVCIVLMS